MALPIKTLPILEKWDCHSCGNCCRGTTIALDKDDLAKLAAQHWDQHPEYQGVPTVVRQSWFGGQRVLAKTARGACTFLTSDNRCRIHELHGAEAKPAVCRMFPFQLVTVDRKALLTVRRSCPSAAADLGSPVADYVGRLKKSGLTDRFAATPANPPRIARRTRRSWSEFQVAARMLSASLADDSVPLVRRIVRGLHCCALLDESKLPRIKASAWPETMALFQAAAVETAGEVFRDRQPPSRSAKSLLRQIGVHYIRAHPAVPPATTWRERWRMMWMSTVFARGNGELPQIHPGFSATTFQQLEQPLGPLPESVILPLTRYFETQTVSHQYVLLPQRWSLVESFRALALTHAVAFWLLRLASVGRVPAADDAVAIVGALDRGSGLPALFRAATALAGTQQLDRLVAWYAR